MNGRTFLKLGALVLMLGVTLVGVAQATTYYVNVVTGLDGKNGLSPTVGPDPIGPKQTINNAIAAASAGDTIIVDYGFGNLYNETVTVNKRLTFGVSSNNSSGTPQVVAWIVNIPAAAPNNTCTFVGPLKFNTGLTLTIGNVIGGNNLTVGGTITRTWQAGGATPTVDAQLNYTGVVNFVYTGGGAITTGFELPAAGNTTNFGNLTTTVAGTNLTLNESKTMNGVLSTAGAGTLNLGGGTLTIVGTSGAHDVSGGNVTNGTLAFTLSGGGATLAGGVTLPNVSTSATAANTLTLAAATSTGNLTASGSASMTVTAATTVGNVSNSGSGAVALTAATTITSITNSGSGNVQANAAGATTVSGNVSQSGTGSVRFNSTTSTSVGGSVTNSPALALTDAAVTAASNRGVIRFVGDFPVTITGAVTNSATFSGATGGTTPTNWQDAGMVRFESATTNVTVTGGVVVSSSSTITYGGSGAPTVSQNGGVIFLATSGNVFAPGGFSNSSSWPSVTSVTMNNNGAILVTARTTGVVGTTGSRTGAVVNTSSASNGTGNGDINFGAGTASGAVVGFAGTSVRSSGAAGGSIVFGNQDFNVSGSVTNERTSAYATGHIQIGSAATAGADVSISGSLSSSGSSTTAINALDNGVLGISVNIVCSGGTITTPNAGTTGDPTITIFGASISGGTVSFFGDGNIATAVTFNGPTSFTGGTFAMGSTVARTLQLGGLTNSFSSINTSTNFGSTNMANVTLLIQPTLVIATQTITGNALTTVWYGPLTANNASGLQPYARFAGGNFRVLNNVTFSGILGGTASIEGITLFIGGQLAPFAGVGNFTNAAGYVTDATGFVSMNGNGPQTVSGAGSFGNFEMDATGQTITYSAGLGPFVGTFNLTAGTTAAGTAANINFNNTPPPTIVRNAGTFDVAPTFTSQVNVTYIGGDKTTANELPTSATKLNNLTVATTNGTNVAGQGRIDVAVATTVNGVLTVNAGQALRLVGVDLAMNGPTIWLYGDIANDVATSQLALAAATGTTISGAGVLPDIQVNAGSVNNSINGATGLATGLLGPDGLRGTDDINPGATGSIVYVGPTASSLTVAFGTANTTTGTHLATVTTATGGTFTLGANLLQASNLTHAAGTVDVATYTYRHNGTTPSITGGALTVGSTGSLQFRGGATTLSLNTSDVTIAANVVINLTAAGSLFTLDPTTAGNLIIGPGNLTLTQGTVQLGNAGTARNLTLTGTAFTIGASGSINTVGIGTLRLNATVPPLTMSYTGTPTLGNVRVSNDVVLAGTGTALTITGTFTHDGGNLDFNTRTLTIGVSPLTPGTFNRTAGTYSATTGYLVIAGGSFNQGASNFTIPNLRIASGGAFAAGGTGVVTVTAAFDLFNGGTNVFTHAGTLAIANGATVNYQDGSLDVVPTYLGTITLNLVQTGSITIPATVWPATPTTLVTTLNSAGAGTVTLPGSRTVNNALTLTSGTLNVPTATTLTIAANSTITRVAGFLTLSGTGAIVFGTGINVVYAGTGALTTGPELPATVNNLTFTRTGNLANFATTILSHVTVTGTLTIRNNITGGGGQITANGPVTVLNDTGTLATGPVMAFDPGGAFGTPLNFGGSVNQTLTLNGNRTMDWIQLSQQAGTVLSVTIAQGTSATPVSLTITGAINFVNGLLVTGANTVVLPTVVQGFNRLVTAGNWSHIVGNVRKNPGAFFVGRLEYPLGTAGTPPAYRPVAITFLLTDPLITAAGLTFNHVNSPPLGTIGFPIDAGSFISLTAPAPFYWLGVSTVGLGPSQTFDLELMAEGYTTYQSGSFGISQLRIVRRFDGSELTNKWVLQGGANYSNFITNVPVPGTPIVRVIGSQGGIEPQASRFTIGRGFITDVQKDPKGIPTEYNLSQNYPNPFNPTTLINFDIPKQSPVTLEIYDMLGQKVKTLINGEEMDPGYYKVSWNGTNQSGASVASGVYYYRVVADKFVSLKKMMFLK